MTANLPDNCAPPRAISGCPAMATATSGTGPPEGGAAPAVAIGAVAIRAEAPWRSSPPVPAAGTDWRLANTARLSRRLRLQRPEHDRERCRLHCGHRERSMPGHRGGRIPASRGALHQPLTAPSSGARLPAGGLAPDQVPASKCEEERQHPCGEKLERYMRRQSLIEATAGAGTGLAATPARSGHVPADVQVPAAPPRWQRGRRRRQRRGTGTGALLRLRPDHCAAVVTGKLTVQGNHATIRRSSAAGTPHFAILKVGNVIADARAR